MQYEQVNPGQRVRYMGQKPHLHECCGSVVRKYMCGNVPYAVVKFDCINEMKSVGIYNLELIEEAMQFKIGQKVVAIEDGGSVLQPTLEDFFYDEGDTAEVTRLDHYGNTMLLQVRFLKGNAKGMNITVDKSNFRPHKEQPMSTAQDQLKQLEDQQRKLADEMAALRKRIEDEAKTKYVGILPTTSAHYSVDHQSNYLYSGNCAQRDAFTEALAVMWELRKQPGIVVPDGHKSVYVLRPALQSSGKTVVNVDNYRTFSACFSPAFESFDAANGARLAVGEERIIKAFTTLLFMTPASRGEV